MQHSLLSFGIDTASLSNFDAQHRIKVDRKNQSAGTIAEQ
jgi:hypothetical protein